jgi:pre-rRNA-processing protein TSR3
MLPTIILRHKKENLKKCSLQGLEHREGFAFYTYPNDPLPDISLYLILALGENIPVLTKQDHNQPLLLIDATWRYAEKMLEKLQINPSLQFRSLPSIYQTAYPRKQTLCPDPIRGLASIEALYVSYHILERKKDFLLDNYYWKDLFLQKNQQNFS